MLESLNSMKFILVAINLIILYVALRKTLFKPVMEFMDNRTNSIRNAIEDAQKQRNEASEMKRALELQLQGAKEEGDRIIEDARMRAEKEYSRIIANAQREADAMLAKAREEIENERELMLKDIRSQVAGLALAAASRVIEANMDTESNRILVEKFIDEVGAA